MAYENQLVIIRQNQSANVRELLKAKGYLNFVTTYEVMAYTELWVDYCVNGPTDTIKARFKQFDEMIEKRMNEVMEFTL